MLVATCGLFGINLSLLSWPQLPMGNLVYSKQFDRGGSSSSQQTTLLTTRRRGHCSVYPLSALSRRMENDTGPLSFNAKESSEWQVRLFCDAQTLLLWQRFLKIQLCTLDTIDSIDRCALGESQPKSKVP